MVKHFAIVTVLSMIVLTHFADPAKAEQADYGQIELNGLARDVS